MATSNSRDFNPDVAAITETAFELIGHESRTGYDLVRARNAMNIMLKGWANRGINLWTVERSEDRLASEQNSVCLNEGEFDIIDCAVRYSGKDYPLERIVRSDYVSLPNKDQEGRPTQIYLERTIPPTAYLWPVPSDTNYTFISYRLRHIQDADASVETVDVPAEFFEALTAGLAYYLAMMIAPERIEFAKMHYDEVFALALSENTERGSMLISPAPCR